MALVEHLERHLGPIEVGWSADPDGTAMPFHVVRFGNGTGLAAVAFSTLGLSRFGLRSPASGREIWHELLMLVPETLRAGPIPGLLQQVGSSALDSGQALLRGDVLGPHGPLVPGSSMEALYVAMPAYLPDEFASCTEETRPIAIAWLVPISASEAEYVATRGWDEFEDRLVELNPDLTDLHRAPMTLSP